MAVQISDYAKAPSPSWFMQFLKDELKPYPGRWITVGRMILTAVLTMLVVMTLRSPNSGIGIFFGLTISRENPASTIKDGFQTILAFIAGLVYVLIGVTIFVNDQLPHFIFIALSLAVMFFVMRTLKSYSAAFGFCFIVVTALPVWDLPFPVDAHVDDNLWAVFGVILGVGITIAVEYIFSPRQKQTEEIQNGLTHRLSALHSLFQAYLDEKDIQCSQEMEDVKQLARIGVGRLQRFLARSSLDDEPGFQKAKWRAFISITERLIDTASSLGIPRKQLTHRDKSRLQELQQACSTLIAGIESGDLISFDDWKFPSYSSRALPLLSELEKKFKQLPHTDIKIESSRQRWNLASLHWKQLFIGDAFSNTEYLHFAVKGMLTGLACYTFYSAVDWHGLGNSLATCVITALSTMGSSRQKQILRIGGAIFGGLVFGIGTQAFILPNLDTIFGFTVLFALVTGVSAWITTSSPRLSYFGLQMALAFYLIMFQSPAIETSLEIGRDRVVGTLFGLLAMWCIFDQLWVKPAVQEMKDAFAANMRHLGELAQLMLSDSRSLGMMNSLRENIRQSFNTIDKNADVILFEFGIQRQEHLFWRSRMKAWQNLQEELFLAQLAINHYRAHIRLTEWPESLRQALLSFNVRLDSAWNTIASSILQTRKLSFPEESLEAQLMLLRKEAFIYFGSEKDPESIRSVEAILDLDEKLVAITEQLKRDVIDSISLVNR